MHGALVKNKELTPPNSSVSFFFFFFFNIGYIPVTKAY
jgi:hypothetical protein